MKWTKDKDDKLTKLILLGKKHEEISKELNTTKKSVSNRCLRLDLKIIYNKEYKCKNCEKTFIGLISRPRIYCSNSCSAKINSVGKKQTEETKKKRSEKLKGIKKSESAVEKISGKNNPKWIDGRSRKHHLSRKERLDGNKKCKYCNYNAINKQYKVICDDCRLTYYKFYRPSCEFNFDIKQYKNEFDFSLIELYGMYSPTNKNNNLGGVSKDHIYSVKDGFINKINPEIIKHPANCSLILQTENSSKCDKSLMTLEELLKKIEIWDKKYGFMAERIG
jgi:hypothetical protein